MLKIFGIILSCVVLIAFASITALLVNFNILPKGLSVVVYCIVLLGLFAVMFNLPKRINEIYKFKK